LSISLADLIPHLTITRQVELVMGRERKGVSMLRISESPLERGTLILLHPLIGGVQMPYRNLIVQLAKEYEINGFEHPETFRRDFAVPRIESIVHLVSSYVQSNRSSLSSSKRLFMGASLGALLAFEMASQLDIEADLIVIDGTSNAKPTTPTISWEEHRSMMTKILSEYRVEDEILINHMISHSWQMYQISKDYKPTRNERISVHVFSCCGTDLNWSEIALVKSVNRLGGDHSQILDPINSSLVSAFVRLHF
ncbi:hypothetical protein PMAYCL1PPCAC_18710, partial [Pristionchus mayeri]